MIHPSKLCFNRHTTAARNRLSSRPLRLAILLLLLGTLLTAAPWASRHFGSPLETSPRRYHRRRLLSSASAASSSVTWLHSVFRNSSLGQYFSSPTVRDASEATPPAYPPDAGPLHMRRHVSPDYFQPSATPRVRNETQRDLHAETASGGKSPTSTSEVCVAIASMPRVFPKQRRLPPWHFPVSLLSMLEERRSPPESADGFKDMRVVVYSSGCNGKPAGAVAATTAASPRATAKSNVSDGLNGSDGFSDGAEHVQAETSTTNGRDRSTSSSSTTKEDGVVPISPEELEERKKTLAAAMHERALKSAARKSSLDITVLPPRQDACDFVQQDEENVRQIGVTDEMASDGWEPWRWRTKLVMDFVYVMRQCMATKPKYILLLQDDTKPARLYDIGIEKFINEELKGQEWTVLALYYPQSYLWPYQHGQNYLVPCCAQALLFNVSALEGLLGFVEEHFTEAPMDWLLNQYLTGFNRTGYVHVPSLFQHIGDVRTKAPGVVSRTHRDRGFRDDYVVNLLMEANDNESANGEETAEGDGEGSGVQMTPRQVFRAYPTRGVARVKDGWYADEE